MAFNFRDFRDFNTGYFSIYKTLLVFSVVNILSYDMVWISDSMWIRGYHDISIVCHYIQNSKEQIPFLKVSRLWNLTSDVLFKIYVYTCGDLVFSGHNSNVVIFFGSYFVSCKPVFTKCSKAIFIFVFVLLLIGQPIINLTTRR